MAKFVQSSASTAPELDGAAEGVAEADPRVADIAEDGLPDAAGGDEKVAGYRRGGGKG